MHTAQEISHCNIQALRGIGIKDALCRVRTAPIGITPALERIVGETATVFTFVNNSTGAISNAFDCSDYEHRASGSMVPVTVTVGYITKERGIKRLAQNILNAGREKYRVLGIKESASPDSSERLREGTKIVIEESIRAYNREYGFRA